MKSIGSCVVLTVIMLVSLACTAQDPGYADIGIRPFGSYLNSKIYSVNLHNGNVYGSIPLASYPQKGKLPPLTFSLNFNTSAFEQETACFPMFDECYTYYENMPGMQNGSFVSPGVQLTTSYSGGQVQATQVLVDGFENLYFTEDDDTIELPPQTYEIEQWSAADITGSTHTMVFDSSNLRRAYAADGSGYSLTWPLLTPPLVSPTSGTAAPNNPFYVEGIVGVPGFPTLTSPDGISVTSTLTASDASLMTVSDAAGNAVYRIPGPSSDVGQVASTIQDSLGRVFPDYEAMIASGVGETFAFLPGYSTNISKCPDLGAANQLPSFAITVPMPGVYGKLQSYVLCYTTVNYRTQFLSNTAGIANGGLWPSVYYPPCTSCVYSPGDPTTQLSVDSFGETTSIQSVVLPDGSYWGFLYDAAITSGVDDNAIWTESYGTISKIIYPTGGSDSFSYITTEEQPASEYVSLPAYRSVHTITESDANGNAAMTTFNYIGNSTGTTNSASLFPSEVDVEDAAGNTTTHQFVAYGCGAAATCYSNFPPPGQIYETSSLTYTGPATGTPLISTATQYQVLRGSNTTNPRGNFVAAYPLSVTSSASGSTISVITYGYPSLLNSSVVQCTPVSCFSADGADGAVLPYDVPYQSTVVDGAGNVVQVKTTKPMYAAGLTGSAAYQNANLLNLVSSATVEDGAGNVLAKTTYGYDEPGSPQGQYGDQTSVTNWLNTGGSSPVSSRVYSAPYVLSSSVDPNQNEMFVQTSQCPGTYPAGSLAETSYPLLPQTLISAYGTAQAQTTSSVVDCTTGARVSGTDPNGVQTLYSYYAPLGQSTTVDPLNRLTEIQSVAGITGFEDDTTFNYPSLNQGSSAQDQYATGDGRIVSRSSFDGLGRVIQQVRPDGYMVDTAYDVEGHVYSVSTPHLRTPATTDGQTVFYYDAAGRMKKRQAPDSYRTWTYGLPSGSASSCFGLATVQTDELGRTTQSVTDALGRTICVVDAQMTLTTYSYNALGDLIQVNQAGNSSASFPETPHQRTFTYDSLSRLVCASDPESATIPASAGGPQATPVCPFTPLTTGHYPVGTTSYSYDSNGNMNGKTDANGVITFTAYDALNRITQVQYASDQAETPTTCYAYDGAATSYLVGRLHQEWTQPYGTTCATSGVTTLSQKNILSYYANGQPQQTQQCVWSTCSSGQQFTLTHTYDRAGEPLSTSQAAIPGLVPQMTVTNTFDAGRRLYYMQSSWDGTPSSTDPLTLFSVKAFGFTGAPAQWSLGNYLNLQRSVDVYGRPTNLTVAHQ